MSFAEPDEEIMVPQKVMHESLRTKMRASVAHTKVIQQDMTAKRQN